MADRNRVLKNCDAASGWDGVDFNISAERLYDLLDSTTTARGELGRSAKDLLAEMAAGPWRVTAGIHAGGIGGGGRPADPRSHITIRTQNNTYHVRFHSSGGFLIEIS